MRRANQKRTSRTTRFHGSLPTGWGIGQNYRFAVASAAASPSATSSRCRGPRKAPITSGTPREISASRDVEKEMRRYKRGTARSGPGGKAGRVKSRKQAIAIGLSKARKKGKKVPKRRG